MFGRITIFYLHYCFMLIQFGHVIDTGEWYEASLIMTTVFQWLSCNKYNIYNMTQVYVL